jgi:hypothetical protein
MPASHAAPRPARVGRACGVALAALTAALLTTAASPGHAMAAEQGADCLDDDGALTLSPALTDTVQPTTIVQRFPAFICRIDDPSAPSAPDERASSTTGSVEVPISCTQGANSTTPRDFNLLWTDRDDTSTLRSLSDVVSARYDGIGTLSVARAGYVRLGRFQGATFLLTINGDVPDQNCFDGGSSRFEAGAQLEIEPGEADLAVDLDATGSLLGSRIDYTVTAADEGPDEVAATTVRVALPRATTAIASSACTYDAASDVATCPLTDVLPEQPRSIRLTATLGALTIGLGLPATAQVVNSKPADPNSANDRSTATCTAVTSLVISCP